MSTRSSICSLGSTGSVRAGSPATGLAKRVMVNDVGSAPRPIPAMLTSVSVPGSGLVTRLLPACAEMV